MFSPLIVALALQASDQVIEPNRLALTPIMDGKMVSGEWDSLERDESGESYFQWEPGILYLGGKARTGDDIVFSLDLLGDGWLIGSDNLEVRLSWVNGGIRTTARILDAANRTEPRWLDAPYVEESIAATGTAEPESWVAEVRLRPIGLPQIEVGRTVGIRCDRRANIAGEAEAYMPRRLQRTVLRWERSRNLPSAMEWKPETLVRRVVPDESLKIRFNFSNPGENAFDSVSIGTLGLAENDALMMKMPFPPFDKKGRAFVDYATRIRETSLPGYRIVRASLTGSAGESSFETSFLIGEPLSVQAELPDRVMMNPESQVISGKLLVLSNTEQAIKGLVRVTVPPEWSLQRGAETKLLIYQGRGFSRIPITLIAPQKAQGLVPIQVEVDLDGRVIRSKHYLVIR